MGFLLLLFCFLGANISIASIKECSSTIYALITIQNFLMNTKSLFALVSGIIDLFMLIIKQLSLTLGAVKNKTT